MSYFRTNIEKLEGYVPGFQPSGAKVVKLNTNENPYPPSQKVVQAIRNISSDEIRRYPQALGDTFRKAAAKVNNVASDCILCCNGGDDLLTIAMRAFCDEKRPVAYASPTYSLYPVLAKLQSCPVVEVDFGPDYGLPDELRDTGAALTIVCNPNAPTGSFIDPEELHDLANKLEGKSILLIDEAYVDFALESCVHLVSSLDNVIILRSMSKGYSLAGLRFGYAIAQKEIIEGLIKVKDSYNVNALSVLAARAAIEDQDYFKENVEKVKSERQKLTESLRGLSFEVPDSQTNFILAKCVDLDAKIIYDELARRDIYVRYFDLPGLSDKLRITIGTPHQNEALLSAVNEIIEPG